MKKKTKRNTTPVLAVKTLASQGTFAEVSAIGGTTTRARVEGGKQRGNVMWGSNQRRRNGGVRPSDNGSRIRSRNDYRDVVKRCVWKTNCRGGLSGFCDSRGRNGEGWNRW